MYVLNDGLIHIYPVIPAKNENGKQIFDLGDKLGSYWFSYLGIFANEYYASHEEQTKVDKRVRILRNLSVCNQQRAIIDDIQYKIGRVFHGVNKSGIPITDISLERIDVQYEHTRI